MSTHVFIGRGTLAVTRESGELAWTRYGVPVGRALFAAIFLLAGPEHFKTATIAQAGRMGVPFAGLMVPVSGVLAMIGGLSVLLGFRARAGAAMLVLFLLPVTLAMHAFWSVADPQAAQIQVVMFFKNLALIGAAMLIGHFGAGPFSLDARHERYR
jgi:putative oxidoreductase